MEKNSENYMNYIQKASFQYWERLLQLIKESYEYLISSIENHPDQDSVMMLMEKTGFFRSNFYNIFSGLISIHWGYKT